jgi:hypothetical protein
LAARRRLTRIKTGPAKRIIYSKYGRGSTPVFYVLTQINADEGGVLDRIYGMNGIGENPASCLPAIALAADIEEIGPRMDTDQRGL